MMASSELCLVAVAAPWSSQLAKLLAESQCNLIFLEVIESMKEPIKIQTTLAYISYS